MPSQKGEKDRFPTLNFQVLSQFHGVYWLYFCSTIYRIDDVHVSRDPMFWMVEASIRTHHRLGLEKHARFLCSENSKRKEWMEVT